MKSLLVFASLLVCSVALADDITVMRNLNPRQTKTINFDVMKGTSMIEVTSDTPNAIFDCTINKENGQTYTKTNTNRCDFVIDFDVAHTLSLHVKNDTNKPLDVAAHFHSKSK